MSSPISRRTFLTSAATAAGAVALGCRDPGIDAPSVATAAANRLSDPESSGIEHIVVFMMENRSFDHLLGWLPGADGRQAGLTYADKRGIAHSTYRLAPDFQGCAHPNPEHSYSGSRVAYDHGKCDGFLRAGKNDLYAIGYYSQGDLPFFGAAA